MQSTSQQGLKSTNMNEDETYDKAGPSKIEEQSEKSGLHESPISQALHDAAENISMAGLQEAMTEQILAIRVMFVIVVASCVGCSIYYTYGVVMEWKTAGYTTDVQDVYGLESMPISNMTICADVNINQTHVRRNITVPAELAKRVENETGYKETEFMDYFVKFITLSFTPRTIPQSLVRFFRMLMEANPQTSAFTDFLQSSFPPCRSMLQNCKLDGVSFDCCENSITILDLGGLCYQITMSHDESSLHQSPLTRRQVTPNIRHGLTLQVNMDLDDILWLERDMSAGFKIYLAPSGFPPTQSPLIAPSSAETFIQVTASDRSLAGGCLLMGKTPVTFGGSYYDSHGDMCREELVERAIHTALNCHLPYFHVQAEKDSQCGPQSNFIFAMFLSHANEMVEIAGMKARGVTGGATERAIADSVHLVETAIRSIAQHRLCQKRCRYWEYSGSASYVDLDPENSTAWKNGDVLYSRIHIYYADFAYRQYSEAPAVSRYTAFCNFGNVIGLYLGMSFVGIAEIFFWFGKLAYVVVREKRQRLKRVEPSTG